MSRINSFHALKQRSIRLKDRLLNQSINISLTGLSRSGKSTFLTSTLHLLLYANKCDNLPFFSILNQKRLIAAKLVESDDLKIPTFPYKQNIETITNGLWPSSTERLMCISLALKYQTKNPFLRSIQPYSVITLNFYDYPGEWLLDLLLLKMDFDSWSEYAIELLKEHGDGFKRWKDFLTSKKKKETTLDRGVKLYRQLISECKALGGLITPGRHAVPGELEGSPILDFFPVCNRINQQDIVIDSSVYELLKEKFERYKKDVVFPFFKEYFTKIDRQVLLVDCIDFVRNSGVKPPSYISAINKLILHFNYGSANWFSRLFMHKISKVLVVGTKSDQLPTEQQSHLQSFLESMFYELSNEIRFNKTELDFITVASVKATQSVVANQSGKPLQCVKGELIDNREKVIVYPGIFPQNIQEYLAKPGDYDLPSFAPSKIHSDELSHLRMGKVFEFLIGDLFL